MRCVSVVTLVLLTTAGVLAQDLHWTERPGWRFVTGGVLQGPPVISESGNLYLTAADRYLYALDPTGRMRWRFDLSTRPTGFQVVSPSGVVHVGRRHGRVLTLLPDGRRLWEYQAANDSLLPLVCLPNGQLMVSEEIGAVSLLSAGGVRLWTRGFSAALSAPPVVDVDGRLWVAMVDGTLAVVDTAGAVTRRLRVNEHVTAFCPSADGMLIGSADGTVAEVRSDGSAAWRTEVGSAVRYIVSGADATRYVLLQNGSVVCLDSDGRQRWRAAPEGRRVTEAIAGEGVVLTLDDGTLLSLGPDGRSRWQLRAPRGLERATLSPEGLLVGGADNWIVYGVWTPAAAQGIWPYVRGDAGATGVAAGSLVVRRPVREYEATLDFVYLQEQLTSGSASERARALEELETRVRAGDLAGSYHYVLHVLEAIAGNSGTPLRDVYGSARTDVQARLVAIGLLGIAGDHRSLAVLRELVVNDETAGIRIAAVRALMGLYTPASAPLVTATVERAISEDLGRSRSDRSDAFGAALLELLVQLVRLHSGAPPDGAADALVLIAEGAYGSEVARRAAAFASGEQ